MKASYWVSSSLDVLCFLHKLSFVDLQSSVAVNELFVCINDAASIAMMTRSQTYNTELSVLNMGDSMLIVLISVLLYLAWRILQWPSSNPRYSTPKRPANTRAELAVLKEEAKSKIELQDLIRRELPNLVPQYENRQRKIQTIAKQAEITPTIGKGHQPTKYPFLKTKTPTDTLSHDLKLKLPFMEQRLLQFKQLWLSTQYPRRLATTVDRIIKAPKGRPISNVVCLAVGGRNEVHDVQRFVVFSQIVAQLCISWLELSGKFGVLDLSCPLRV